MPAKKDIAVRAAKWVGPLAAEAAARLWKNPEARQTAREQASHLVRRRGGSTDDLIETIAILRSEVTYLAESADDEEEAERARAWMVQVDRCEHAAQLLKAPGSTRAERSALTKKVSSLRSEIFGAYLLELDEDTQTGDSREP